MARWLVTVMLLVAAPGQVPAAPTSALPASERPPITRAVAFEQRLGAALPQDARFVAADGTPVRLGDLLGERPVLLVPAYYECPMLCTLVLNGLVSMLRALPLDPGDAFDVVVFSIDPDETPALAAAKRTTILEAYRRPDADRGWHFLTGSRASIAALTEAIGFRYAWDEASRQWAHASGLVVVTPEGRASRYFFGVEFSPRDVRLAVVEASAGTVGTLVDQVLLFCLQWDPSRGRYTPAVLGAVRLAGLATLLALGAFLWQSRGRPRRPEGRA